MCILATATRGAEFNREDLLSMFYANPDGAGWAYAKDGKIYFAKGYTNANKFIKAVLKLPTDCERMVHCRIATHGGITKHLTHPFPITTDYQKMELLSGVLSKGYILAHNGILNNFTPDKSHSDTEELARALAHIDGDIMREGLRCLINALVDGSRVAILNTDGKINRYGSGWTEDNGIYYSNRTWMWCKRGYGAYTYNDYYDYDDAYYSAYYSSANSTPSIGSLVDLDEGAVVIDTAKNKAHINPVKGSYLMDAKTGALYGQYKGTLFSTDYRECRRANCIGCNVDCVLMHK